MSDFHRLRQEGSHHLECATHILHVCHSIFRDLFIFSLNFFQVWISAGQPQPFVCHEDFPFLGGSCLCHFLVFVVAVVTKFFPCFPTSWMSCSLFSSCPLHKISNDKQFCFPLPLSNSVYPTLYTFIP